MNNRKDVTGSKEDLSNVSISQFIRGIQLSSLDLKSGNKFSSFLDWACNSVPYLKELDISDNGLQNIPPSIFQLSLEKLNISRNDLKTLPVDDAFWGSLIDLSLCHNSLSNFPSQIAAHLMNISHLDLSFNCLSILQRNIFESCRFLVFLNLSNNNLEKLPTLFFHEHTHSLRHLDISHNNVTLLARDVFQLNTLEHLNVSFNPLPGSDLVDVFLMKNLKHLYASSLHSVTVRDFTMSILGMDQLETLELSKLQLDGIPLLLYRLKSLRHLNLSFNNLYSEQILPILQTSWRRLKHINLSDNRLTVFPVMLDSLPELETVILDNNCVKSFKPLFESAKQNSFQQLKCLSMKNNLLISIPRTLCFLPNLKELFLEGNPLTHIPEEIHQLPCSFASIFGENATVYVEEAGAEYIIEEPHRIPAKLDILGEYDIIGDIQQKYLFRTAAEIMNDIGSNDQESELPLERALNNLNLVSSTDTGQFLGISTDRQLAIDYSILFKDVVHNIPGTHVYRIQGLQPSSVAVEDYGTFNIHGAYLILHTVESNELDEHNNDIDSNTGENKNDEVKNKQERALVSYVYFWIGRCASLQKQTAVAMLAVHLRNYISTSFHKIRREEQGSESDAFLSIFSSLFYSETLEAEDMNEPKLIAISPECTCLFEIGLNSLFRELPLDSQYIVADRVYFLKKSDQIFYYCGADASAQLKINLKMLIKRLNKEGIEINKVDFLSHLGETGFDRTPNIPALFRIDVDRGQCDFIGIKPPYEKSQLDSNACYLLIDQRIYVWIGKKSLSIDKLAAVALARIMTNYGIERQYENIESELFKMYFTWSVPVIQDRLRKKMKIEAQALFQSPKAKTNSLDSICKRINESLEKLAIFVYRNGEFISFPSSDYGRFDTQDFYVVMCIYKANNSKLYGVVYCWEGHMCKKEAWLAYCVDFKQVVEESIRLFVSEKYNLRTIPIASVRVHEMKEPFYFLCHFNEQMIVKRYGIGVFLYHIRTDVDETVCHAVEIKFDLNVLCSLDCYLLYDQDKKCCMLWHGNRSSYESRRRAKNISKMITENSIHIDLIYESLEPKHFWSYFRSSLMPLSSKEVKLTFCQQTEHEEVIPRFFRCSTAMGYFEVIELRILSQFDLCRENSFIVDDRRQNVYLWCGSGSNDRLKHLSKKGAESYAKHVYSNIGETNVIVVEEGLETTNFKLLFHGWFT